MVYIGLAVILLALILIVARLNKIQSLLNKDTKAALGLPHTAASAPGGIVAQDVPAEVVAAIAGAIAAIDTGAVVRSISPMPVRKNRGAWGYAGVCAVTEPF